MSIRARLTIMIALVLLLTVAVLGAVAVQTTRATLTEQIDDQVREYAYKTKDDNHSFDEPQFAAGPNAYEAVQPSDEAAEFSTRPYARIVYNADGSFAEKPQKYGNRDDWWDLPLCPPLGTDEFTAALDTVTTMDTADGSTSYRVLMDELPGGRIQAVGIPLTNVDEAVSRLMRVVVLATAAALITAIAICWWVIRRGLHPVDEMVATAADIAGGNLGARIAHTSPQTELGKLGNALNDMMRAIQTSDDARTAGERKLRRFVADAAHELRTPLTSLRGYAELYRQGALADHAAVSNAMGRIESEGERMARLVEDLLLLARLDQDRDLERTQVDLGQIAEDALQDFQVVAPDRKATLDIEPGSVVSGDRMRLRQIIDNLLANVRTHTPAGTSVNVSVSHTGTQATLTVRDTGPGIAPDDQERIFERFWRADRARTRSRGGTGLGLAIVASLVEAHGGTIAISSEPGKGAAFSVSLPLASG